STAYNSDPPTLTPPGLTPRKNRMPALVSHHGIWPWIWFNVFVVAMLAIDLGIVHRKKHAVSLKEALAWTGVWVSLALLFALMLFLWSEELGLVAYARDGTPMSEARTAVDFLTAYLIEESLSMDNIFVFLLVFRYFNIPSEYQHKVLFWGILGAVVMRLTFILTGVALLKHVEWVGYIFGGILIFTGVKLWRQGEQE